MSCWFGRACFEPARLPTVLKNSGNRGSLRVCCWIFLARPTPGKIFHLKVGAECLLSPASIPNVFASWDHTSDVWRIWTNSSSYLVLRVVLLEKAAESWCYCVRNALNVQLIPFSERFGVKWQVWEREMCACVCFSHHTLTIKWRLMSIKKATET